jgi:hypothetical protein
VIGVPAWPLALACLPVGFAVAELTGSRPVGGLALVVGGLATVAVARAPLGRKVAWGVVALGCFVVSHVLADSLGAWGSVAVVAAVTGAAGWALLDRAAGVSAPQVPARQTI